MKFSERHGHASLREIIQLESVDEPLRNGLWSVLKVSVWDDIKRSHGMYGGYSITDSQNSKINHLCTMMWFDYFKKPLDKLDPSWNETLGFLRRYFFTTEWYEVLDFIEFVANNYEKHEFKEPFTDLVNTVLQREMSGYRFVGSKIAPITEKAEIAEVEEAAKHYESPVRTHLSRAIELVSDRKAPDYRNSIKESVSAVESLVRTATGDSSGTLGKLLKQLEQSFELHPAMKTAFSNLYGYSSDESGIRHALTETEKVGFAEAKFMLVTCSAFINFVSEKLSIES